MKKNNTTINNTTIITSNTAQHWSKIFNAVEVINGISTPDQFYGQVSPFMGDPREVYNRLTGWRKEHFRRFLMSGVTTLGIDNYPAVWQWGRISPTNTHEVWTSEEENCTLLNWEELCDLYA